MGRIAVALVLVTAGVAHARTTVTGIAVERTPAVAVRIRLSAAATPIVRTLPGDGTLPARVYLDFPGSTLAAALPPSVAGTDVLLRVRAGQFDASTARVVLDLARPATFVVHDADGVTTVELASPAGAQSERPLSPEASAALPDAVAVEPCPPAAAPAADVSAPPAEVAVPAPPPAAIATPAPAVVAAPAPSPPVVAATPPPPASAPASTPTPQRPIVVVDAGHGGHDPGATGLRGVVEKTVTLDVARRLASRLGRLPVEVRLTRDRDAYRSIPTRLALVPDATVFISLHANAAERPTLHGVEVFFGGGGPEPASSGSRSPARLGLDTVEALERRLGHVRTVVRPGGYGILAHNAVPSVLVEIGYLTNPADAARIASPAYLDEIADALVDAVGTFLADEPGARPLNVAAR
jgi:N-acetylmuramoyl-L-alanine amidase